MRAVLTQTSITLPVAGGRCDLGTWQGVYLWDAAPPTHDGFVGTASTGGKGNPRPKQLWLRETSLNIELRSRDINLSPNLRLADPLLQLGVPMVTAFQVCRLVAVLVLAEPVFRWWQARRVDGGSR